MIDEAYLPDKMEKLDDQSSRPRPVNGEALETCGVDYIKTFTQGAYCSALNSLR